MPAIAVTEEAIELIDKYREQVEWNVNKKDVATKAIEEFYQRHVGNDEEGS